MGFQDRPANSRGKLLFLVAGLAVASVVASMWRNDDRSPLSAGPGASASASGSSAPEPSGPPARCEALGKEAAFVLGDPPPPRPDAGVEEQQFAPFAAVLGRGAVSRDGFLLGALRDAEGGTIANLVRLGAKGQSPTEVRLARSRGDMEAPVVAAHEDAALVAMLEPDAGGRTLRLGRVVGDKVTWGAEIPQGMDESMAVDLAVSGDRAMLAWDDFDKDGDASRVVIAPFDARDVGGNIEPRPVTRPDADAETPRLFSRPGGYWLLYVVRGRLSSVGAVPAEARDEPSDKDEVDEQRGGERMRYAWIEALPLTEKGEAAGEPRRVTPADGHAIAFDALADEEGAIQLAWRDERSPLGGSGGTVLAVRIDLGGVTEPVVVLDEDVGDGVPSLLPGWIAIMPLSGPMLLGRLTKQGDVEGAISPEPLIGRAQPIAAKGELILLGRPMGKAVELEVVSCP